MTIDRRDNGRWRARWREYPGGPQKSRTFDRKLDAQRFLDSVRGDLVKGAYVDPDAGRVTFQEFAEEWRTMQAHRPSTAAQCETYLRRHAYPALGRRALADIRPSHIQAWVREVSQHLAPGTVETVYRWVASVMKAAVLDRRIAVSPCVGVTLPRREPSRIEPLTADQVEALGLAMAPRYSALVTTLAGSGLRSGEAFGLTVDRVDFLRRTLTVDRQLVGVAAGIPRFGPPKTEASWRTIPLPLVVTEALARHFEKWGAGPEGLVFTNTEGRPIRRNSFGAAWQRGRRAAGLPEWATPHDLRHFYASLLIHHGLSVKAVQSRLGHESAMVTLDTYGHMWPDSDDDTRSAVDDVLGARAV